MLRKHGVKKRNAISTWTKTNPLSKNDDGMRTEPSDDEQQYTTPPTIINPMGNTEPNREAPVVLEHLVVAEADRHPGPPALPTDDAADVHADVF